jgi:hypothetical protein
MSLRPSAASSAPGVAPFDPAEVEQPLDPAHARRDVARAVTSHSFAPGRAGSSSSQARSAAKRLARRAGAAAATIRSPRETSSSRSRRSATDCPVKACSSRPSCDSIAAMRAQAPPGWTRTSAPTRIEPLATRPAWPRRAALARPVAAVAAAARAAPESGTARRPARGVDRRRALLEPREQRRPGVPRQARARRDDVVAGERRDRDRGEGAGAELRRELAVGGDDRLERAAVEVEPVHLVDRDRDLADAEQVRERGVASRLREQLAVLTRVASTRITAASAVVAAVTMLRVYCSWPGVSAMMNLRCAVAK